MSDPTAPEPTDTPAERLIPGAGEAEDTGPVDDSAASASRGAPVHDDRSFAEQDAAKHPGDGPNARD